MAVSLIEGFELFDQTVGNNTATAVVEKYSASSTTNLLVQAGRLGGKAVQNIASAPLILHWIPVASSEEVVIGFAVMFPSTIPTSFALAVIEPSNSRTGNLNAHESVGLNSSGNLIAYLPGGSTHITGGTLTPGVWYYIELHAKIHNSTGFVSLYVDGVQVGSTVTGIDTSNYFSGTYLIGRVEFGNYTTSSATAHYIDDVYVLTAVSGLTPLGPCHVVGLMPTAEGTTINYTPSTGTDNSATVDERPRVTTDYNSDTPTAGNKDLFVLQTLSDTGTVVALQHNLVCATTTGNATPRGAVLSGGSSQDTQCNGAGSNPPATTAGTTVRCQKSVSEIDPDTAGVWTQAAINAADFGYTTA